MRRKPSRLAYISGRQRQPSWYQRVQSGLPRGSSRLTRITARRRFCEQSFSQSILIEPRLPWLHQWPSRRSGTTKDRKSLPDSSPGQRRLHAKSETRSKSRRKGIEFCDDRAETQWPAKADKNAPPPPGTRAHAARGERVCQTNVTGSLQTLSSTRSIDHSRGRRMTR